MQGDIPRPMFILIIIVALGLVGGLGWYLTSRGSTAQATANPPPPDWIDPVTRKPKFLSAGGKSAPLSSSGAPAATSMKPSFIPNPGSGSTK